MISLKRYLEKPAHKLFSSREPNTTSAVRNIKLSEENGFQGNAAYFLLLVISERIFNEEMQWDFSVLWRLCFQETFAWGLNSIRCDFFFSHQSINFAGNKKLGRAKAKSIVFRKCTSILFSEIIFPFPHPYPLAMHWLFFLKPIYQTQEVIPSIETCPEGNWSLRRTPCAQTAPSLPMW